MRIGTFGNWQQADTAMCELDVRHTTHWRVSPTGKCSTMLCIARMPKQVTR